MKKLLVLLGAILLCATESYAANNLILCYSNSGAITARKKCARGETVLNGLNIGGLGLKGQNGTFDPTKCKTRETSSVGTGLVALNAQCLPDEVLMTTGCYSNSTLQVVVEHSLSAGTNGENYNLYGLFTCGIEDLNGNSHLVTAQILCCKP